MENEKRTVKDVLDKLEKFLDENKFTNLPGKGPKRMEGEIKMIETLNNLLGSIPAISRMLDANTQSRIRASTIRADELLSNRKIFFEIMNSSLALAATCQKTIKETGSIDPMLVAKIISVIVAKMENEGLIKINI